MTDTILFSHIPKTAGSSLKHVIETEYAEHDRVAVYSGELRLAGPDPHFLQAFRERASAPRVLYGHFSYGVHEFLDLRPRYFSFLREPVSRVESLYKQLSKPDSKFSERIRDGLSLAEMVEKNATEMTNNHMTRVISGIPAEPGTLVTDRAHLETAMAHIEEGYFFLGTLETLESDFCALAKMLDWKTPEIPYLNASDISRTHCDEKTRRLIEERNELDIALYDWVKTRATRKSERGGTDFGNP